ncbi:MAG: ATP-binding protein [Planctomycetota bacterium]
MTSATRGLPEDRSPRVLQIVRCVLWASVLAFVVSSVWLMMSARELRHQVEWSATLLGDLSRVLKKTHRLVVLPQSEIDERVPTIAQALRAASDRIDAACTNPNPGLRRAVRRMRVAARHADQGLAAELLDEIDEAEGELRVALGALAREIGSRWDSVWIIVASSLVLAAAVLFFSESYARARRRLTESRMRRETATRLGVAQRSESLTLLAGGVAHDLNNLLVGILGNTDLVLERVQPDTLEHECLEDIGASARRCADLARQMLSFAGAGRKESKPVDVNRVVTDTLRLVRSSIGPRCVLTPTLFQGLPVVEADATQLGQVLLNLVTNASDALGQDGGIIAVSTKTVEIVGDHDGLDPGRYVVVEVRDNGPGMDDDTLARAFEPFFTTKPSGRGLGLAAALGIVQDHGGSMRVRSERDGGGTTFEVLLPASAGVAPEPPSSAFFRWSGAGDMLLVDDDEASRAAGRRMLERLGFVVEVAEHGGDGLLRFEAEPRRWAGAVVDVRMPVKSGSEVLAVMRRHRADMPVVVTSGGDGRKAPVQGDAHTRFLQKPYDLDALRLVLRDLMDDCVPRD